MAGEGVRQPEHRRELCAKGAGSENPQRDMGARARNRCDTELFVAGEKGLQFQHILRKLALVAREGAAQGARDALIRSGCASQSQIHTAREQGFEGAELLGDHHRRMVRQHDTGRSDPNALGGLPDMREHDRGRGARDPRHAMMFGDPIARIAERLGMPCEIGGVGERLGDRAGIGNGHEVEEREFRHETDMRLASERCKRTASRAARRKTTPARPWASPSAHRW